MNHYSRVFPKTPGQEPKPKNPKATPEIAAAVFEELGPPPSDNKLPMERQRELQAADKLFCYLDKREKEYRHKVFEGKSTDAYFMHVYRMAETLWRYQAQLAKRKRYLKHSEIRRRQHEYRKKLKDKLGLLKTPGRDR